MSAQLLHAGLSTQYDWNGSVNVDVEPHRRADDVADRPLSEDGVVHHAGIGWAGVRGRGHRQTDGQTDAGEGDGTHATRPSPTA